jgi:GNAT superfamily N-acetyltransferase
MISIVIDLADALALTSASIQGFSRAFGRAARDGVVLEYDGVVGSVAPAIPFRSIFNSAAYRDSRQLAAVLPRLSADYEAAGVTAWGVWVHESDQLAMAAIEAAGLRRDSQPTAMIAALDVFEAGASGGAKLETAQDLEEFDSVLAAAYDFPPGVLVYCFPSLLEEFRGFVARDPAGTPVCALATVEVGGDCGVTLVGTAPEARGQGHASQLLQFALAEARERGCRTSTLQATQMGEAIYARLGYRPFGAMELWEKRSAPDPTQGQ